MKRISWITLAWLVLITSAQAASFPCYNALTTVEKLICSNAYVSTLDDKLIEIYSAKLKSAKFQNEITENSIRQEQKNWLKKRNVCHDITCIKNEYEARIDQLTSINRKGSIPLISEKKAEAVCKEIVELANAGKVRSRLIKFTTASQQDIDAWGRLRGVEGLYLNGILDVDYDRDNKTVHVGSISNGGTCSTDFIIDLGTAIKRRSPLATYIGFSKEEVENFESASWGRSDSLLFVQNEPIVVTANISEYAEDIALVSWFGEGQQRPLCATSALGVEVEITESKVPELCNAVANGDFTPIEWNNVKDRRELEGLRTKDQTEFAETASIDLNADGEIDNVLLLNSSSGAGCGSSRQWLDMFRVNMTNTHRALILALQNFWGPLSRYSDQWKDIKLFKFSGKPYLLANGPKGLGVYSIWENETQAWCTYNLREQISIDHLYPPGGGY